MLLDQFVSKMQLSARGQICSRRSEIILPVEVDSPFDLPPGHDGPGLPDTLAVLDDGKQVTAIFEDICDTAHGLREFIGGYVDDRSSRKHPVEFAEASVEITKIRYFELALWAAFLGYTDALDAEVQSNHGGTS